MAPEQLLLIAFAIFPAIAWIIYAAALRGRLHWVWVFGITCVIEAGIFLAVGQFAAALLSQEREHFAQLIRENERLAVVHADAIQNAEQSRAAVLSSVRLGAVPWAIGWTAFLFIICALVEAAIRAVIRRPVRTGKGDRTPGVSAG